MLLIVAGLVIDKKRFVDLSEGVAFRQAADEAFSWLLHKVEGHFDENAGQAFAEIQGETIMNIEKRTGLEATGFRFGDAADFVELNQEERMLVDLRMAIAKAIRNRREQSNLSQKEVAARIKSTQPRVAKIEAAAADVSLDQMFRGLFAVGGSVEDLVRATAITPTTR